MWRRLFGGAIAAGLALALVGGTLGASAASLPGDTLYPLKQWTEQAQLSLAGSDTSRAQLQLDLLARRLDEINRLVQQGRPVPASVLETVQQRSDNIAGLSQVLSSEELSQKLHELLEHQQQVLANVLDKVPDEAKPALEKAMEKSRTGLERAEQEVQRELEGKGKAPGQNKENKPKSGADSDTTPTSDDANANEESHKVAEAIASFFGVSVQTVTDLKDEGLGFGEVFRLLQWSKDSGKTVQEVRNMLEDEEGWGKVRKELGLEVPGANHPNLGDASSPKNSPTATSSGTPTATANATPTPPGRSGEHRRDQQASGRSG